jgi:nitrogen regulatory protein P-II 1
MKKVTAVIQIFMKEEVLNGLAEIGGFPGVTVQDVSGWGRTRGEDAEHTLPGSGDFELAQKTQLYTVVPDDMVDSVVAKIQEYARTGDTGDGKIFVEPVEDVIRIRTGEAGEDAI